MGSKAIHEIAARQPFVVDAEAFAMYVAAIEAPEGAAHVDDLCLAFACLQREPNALALFRQQTIERVACSQLGRVRLDRAQLDELKQSLLDDLLVGRDGKPGLAHYQGRGPLAGFVRVAAVRLALKLLRGRSAPTSVGDEGLESIALEQDIELGYIKDTYRPVFVAAFREAIGQLTSQERLLLRQQVVDGLSIDALGTLHNVHRATAARWLASAKDRLVTLTRHAFAERVKADGAEIDSLLVLLRSNLDLSLSRVL